MRTGWTYVLQVWYVLTEWSMQVLGFLISHLLSLIWKLLCCVKWSGWWPGLAFSPEVTLSCSGHTCKTFAVVSVIGGGTVIVSHSEVYPSRVSCMCGASCCVMVRTKVTFTTKSGTSTDALQCGFYAVYVPPFIPKILLQLKYWIRDGKQKM